MCHNYTQLHCISDILITIITDLEEGSLTALSHRIDTKLVEAARAGDGGVIIHSLATVNCPVVVTMIVNISIAIKHKTILTYLLCQGT